jgi:glutamine cyclotransferase
MKNFPAFISCISLLGLIACTGADKPDTGKDEDAPTAGSVPAINYTIKSTLPHDTSYYTEGFEFYNNTLLESTGQYGFSKLVQKDPATNKVIKEIKLDAAYFGEGLTVLRDTLYQLTYKEHKVFAYSVKDFKKLAEFSVNTEGWGLTNNGRELIATDGSSNLYFYEPGTFKLLRVQEVREGGSPAVNLNELEYVNGFIYANQWQYPYILKINPATGDVVAKMDFSAQVESVRKLDNHAEVFNGLAYNPVTKKFYVTGKYWPQVYEIDFPM